MSLLVVVGAAVVVVTAVDAFLTVLHPTSRGPLSHLVTRGSFALLRALAGVTGRSSLLSPAGPIAMAGIFAMWVALLWVGYALIYLPEVSELSYAPTADFARRGIVEALYFSGAALTTAGFGDVTGQSDAYRLVSVLEAATGFGVMTAAVTFLLTIHPRVSHQRAAARAVQGVASDPGHAVEMVRGEPFVLSVQQQLIEIGENTERFPILFFFHSKDPGASVSTAFRGAVMTCLACGWGVAPRDAPHAERYAAELRQSIDRTIDHYATRFLHGRDPEDLDRELSPEQARRLLQRLAGPAGNPAVADTDDARVRELARFAGRCDQFLEHIADRHLQDHRPLAEL